MISIETENAGTFPNADGGELRRLVGLLGSDAGSYVIVHRTAMSEGFAQAAIAPKAAQAPHKFVVEFRDEPHRHHQGFTDDIETVVAVLAGWAERGTAWRDALPWQVLDFGE